MTLVPQRPLLGVNIDHTATVRQARYRNSPLGHGRMVEPDPVQLAMVAERAGADAITLHLREDRRHIQPHDVHRLKAVLQTRMNLEMAATDAMVAFAKDLRPECVLLVPEGRTEVTTEGGLDVAADQERLKGIVADLRAHGSEVSLFIDPDAAQIEASAATGADFVELHTGAFANAYYDDGIRDEQLERLRRGALFAHEFGLGVNAGHGINYVNVREARQLPHIREFNIGHAIVSRALFTGFEAAVREMITRLRGG